MTACVDEEHLLYQRYDFTTGAGQLMWECAHGCGYTIPVVAEWKGWSPDQPVPVDASDLHLEARYRYRATDPQRGDATLWQLRAAVAREFAAACVADATRERDFLVAEYERALKIPAPGLGFLHCAGHLYNAIVNARCDANAERFLTLLEERDRALKECEALRHVPERRWHTAEDLAALPDGSVVLNRYGTAFQRDDQLGWEDRVWWQSGHDQPFSPAYMVEHMGPGRIIWEANHGR